MTTGNKTVLICGASVAGLTLAYWLDRYGYNVTMIEQATGPREGGSPIDIRGKALDVAKRMGILEQIQEAKIHTEALSFMNAKGRQVASTQQENWDERPGQDIELERAQLVQALYTMVSHRVNFIFQNSITQIIEKKEEVEVTYREGGVHTFDYVFGADGLHSAVRRLVFGNEEEFAHYLGMYVGVFSVDTSLGKKNACLMYNVPGKMACIYSYRQKADAMLVFRSTNKIDYNYKNIDEQKQLLANAFDGEAWQVKKILHTLHHTDQLYFDPVCQIKMPAWTKGRVALVGDAAYCASFLSGMGITLAMVGATTLADELVAANGNHTMAFKKYEEEFRPFVNKMQATVTGASKFLVPATRSGIWLRNRLTLLFPLMKYAKRLRKKKK